MDKIALLLLVCEKYGTFDENFNDIHLNFFFIFTRDNILLLEIISQKNP